MKWILVVWFGVQFFQLKAQNADSLLVSKTDSLIATFSMEKYRQNGYNWVESSGVEQKKFLLFFWKTIGSLNHTIIHRNDTIYEIRTSINYSKGNYKNLTYTFKDEALIKYKELEFETRELMDTYKFSRSIIVYFQGPRVIKEKIKIVEGKGVDYKRILMDAKSILAEEKKFLKEVLIE